MSKKKDELPPMQNEPNQAEIDKACADLLKATAKGGGGKNGK